MRIPGWVFFVSAAALFVGVTSLCAVLSYTLVRTTIVDARENGVEVPENAIELVNYVLDPPQVQVDQALDQALLPSPTPVLSFAEFVAQLPAPGQTTQPEASEATTPTEQGEVVSVSTEDEFPTWEDPRRLTILLMGVDQRSSQFDTENAHRTDTMILVQVDPVAKTIGMLTIPRDLYVRIPAFNSGRITTANYLGDLNELPGGGPRLAMDTVRANLGVTVDKYVRINFEVFSRVVDVLAPDGIEICVEEEIDDPDYPDEGFGTIAVHFDPGCQTMNTEQLLQYARTRATEGGDFDRNRRQQQVLRALQRHLLNIGGAARFATQIPRLYADLSDSYRTNFSIEEVIALANLVSTIPDEDISSGSITPLHVTFDETADGQQILLPRQNALADAVQQAFDPPRDLSLAELGERAKAENAEIVVYNNTSIRGLASSTREWLTGRGVDVAGVGNIDPPAEATAITIRDYTGNPNTARYLAALLDLPQDSIVSGGDGLTSADVMIVVGTDAERLIAAPDTNGS